MAKNGETKFWVSHILVKHQYEAEDLLRKLSVGAEFSELARKFSTCGSAKSGGDLGEIGLGRTDPDFEAEALRLKPTEVSRNPVRTRFGYHLLYRHA